MQHRENEGPVMGLHTGEDPSTDSAEVAEQWVAFYEELVGFEKVVLEKMRELRERRRPEIQGAVDDSNIKPLEQLISDFTARLEFWRRRAGELTA